MVKEITKVGNSHGLIFDSTLLQHAKLKPGDQVNVEVHNGGTITLTPVGGELRVEDVQEMIDSVMDDYSETMKELSK